jgi:hypothetical protein
MYINAKGHTHVNEATNEQIASQLSLLERQCRELRVRSNIAVAVSLASTFMCLMIAFDAIRSRAKFLRVSSVEAESLTIKNAGGGAAISFGKNTEGQQTMWFLDEKGASRLRIGITGGGLPVLNFFDQSGTPRLDLGLSSVNGNAYGTLDFRNRSGVPRLLLGLSDGDLPQAEWRDPAGDVRVSILLTADDAATLQLSSRHVDRRRGVRIRSPLDADPAIEIFGANATPFRLPPSK